MRDPTPALAYKYLSVDRLTYPEDQLLRFSQPGCLNDPFECYPGLPPHVASQLIQLAAAPTPIVVLSKQIVDTVLIPYLESIASRLNHSIGLLCLSARWNSTLMWSHYANDHRGFCVGFDITHPFFSTDHIAKGGWGPIQTVDYSDLRPQVRLEHLPTEEVVKLLTTKHTDWSYERELRLVRSLHEADKVLQVVNGLQIALYRVPHVSIREMYAGARAPQSLRDTLRSHAKRLSAKFYEAELSINRYDLARWPREA